MWFRGVPVSDVIMRMGYASDSYRKIFSAKNHIGQTAKDNIAEYKRRSPRVACGEVERPVTYLHQYQ